MASSSTKPKPSENDGNTKMSILLKNSSLFSIYPRKLTFSILSFSIIFLNFSKYSSVPLPAIINLKSSDLSSSELSASIKSSIPLFTFSLPRNPRVTLSFFTMVPEFLMSIQ